MKNITDKTKKWLTIAGLGIVCVALVIAISSQFKTQTPVDDVIASPTAVTDNENNPAIDTGDKAEEKEVVIQANEPGLRCKPQYIDSPFFCEVRQLLL
jgi:hypothetical protein